MDKYYTIHCNHFYYTRLSLLHMCYLQALEVVTLADLQYTAYHNDFGCMISQIKSPHNFKLFEMPAS